MPEQQGDASAFDPSATADELFDMRRSGRIEADLPDRLRPRDLAEAYEVQRRLTEAMAADGGRPIGYKVACTSLIAQRALRIDRPLFGRVMSHTTSDSGATLRTSDFTHRVVEAEFGFRLGCDVPQIAGGHTNETISDCIDALVPAIEIVDYRYEAWTIGALQVAADNAIHGWWVRGEAVENWRHLDLPAAGVTVRLNGEVTTAGSGAAVLGNPLTVMAWIADELPRFGLGLRAGDVVTTGVTTDVFEAAAGEAVIAEFEGVGTVDLRFE